MRKQLLAIVYSLLSLGISYDLFAADEEVTLSFERNIGTEVSIEIESDTDPRVEGAYFLRIETQDGAKHYVYQLKDHTIKLSGGTIRALDCSHSDLAQIDVTNLPYLRELRIESNNVESLDLSASTALEILDVGDNRLYDLDLTGLSKLRTLLINGNGLTALNIRDCQSLTLIACYSNAIYQDNMKRLVEALPTIKGARPARMIVVDTESPLEENNCMMSHVAIAKERNWELYDYKGSPQRMDLYYGKDYVPTLSSNYITLQTRLIAGDQIKLMWSVKEGNPHVELDGATILRTDNYGNGPVYVCLLTDSKVKVTGDLLMLDCSDNLVTSIDLSHCTILEELYCHKNGYLQSLDVSMLPSLKRIITTDCALTKLDLSHAPQLQSAYLANMPLTQIDLSHNAQLSILSLNRTQLRQIDLSHNGKLEDLRLSGTQLQQLDLAALPLLKKLYVTEAKLPTLDLTHNPLLKIIRVGKNALTELKLGSHQQLQELDIRSNQLGGAAFRSIVSALPQNDLAPKRRLIAVDKTNVQEANYCSSRSVSEAMSKGWTVYDYNGSKEDMKPFDGEKEEVKPYVSFKTELPKGEKLFITVKTKDGSPISAQGLTYDSSITIDGEEVSIYIISEPEQYLYGDIVLLNLQENYLTALDVTHLTALESLNAMSNGNLTELDISHSPGLKKLYLASTGITSLIIPVESQLQELNLPSTPITALDLTHCLALQGLNINATAITELNLTHCPELTYLTMTKLPITSLDLSQCVKLQRLYLSDCKLQTLDLTHNNELQHIYCENNVLTKIVMPSSTRLDNLFCYGNKITSSEMQAIVEALPDRQGKAAGRFVVINGKADSEVNECTKEQVAHCTAKGWSVYNYNGDSLNMLPYEGITSNTSLKGYRMTVYRDRNAQKICISGLKPLEELSLYLPSGELLLRTQCNDEGACSVPICTTDLTTPLVVVTPHQSPRVI